jgi:transcriptional regulator with XRE-family HTH domain
MDGQSFRQWLQEGRTRKGFSKSELARRVGVTPMAVVNWEAGNTRPRSETLERLKHALSGEDVGSSEVREAGIPRRGLDASFIEAFRRELAEMTGHPLDRILVQITLT